MAKRDTPKAGEPMDDYRAQSDADTLTRAEEIKGDKDRHGNAQAHLKKRFHHTARAMTGGKKTNRFTAKAKLMDKP